MTSFIIMELYAVKKSEFNTVSPDDYVCCRETNLSVECLIHDKVAAKKKIPKSNY